MSLPHWQQQDTPLFVKKGVGTYYANVKFVRFADEQIIIGKYCSIAQGVEFVAGGQHRTDTISTYPFDVIHGRALDKQSRHYKSGPGIVVGNDVWIGWGAKIVGNVTIGSGAVIGAGAVVMTDIPACGIALGNPARVMKYRFSDLNVRRLLNVAWWDWPEEKVKERREWFYRPVEEFLEEFER